MRLFLRFLFFNLVNLGVSVAFPGAVWAQEHSSHGPDRGKLHFSHPLVSESPSPDTKVRLDYSFSNEPGEENEAGNKRHTYRFEAEYAFSPWLSLEVDVPYTFLNPDQKERTNHLDNVDIGIKYANFIFEKHGLLLGGGVEFGLPTGNEAKGIGSDHVLEIEPSVGFGYQINRWEIIGFTSSSLPLSQKNENEADFELGWTLSVLHHLKPQLITLLEFDGEHVFGGEEDGADVINVTPGIKIHPFDDSSFQVGLGVSLPLTNDKEFHAKTILSLFYHF